MLPIKSTGGTVLPTPGLAPQGFAAGGIPEPDISTWVTRRESAGAGRSNGLFDSPVPGRTDQINVAVPAGSYVLPADVVSGLGEGNSQAGAAVLDKMFHTAPYGGRVPAMHGGRGVPRADGGATGKIPIVAAGGEYLVPREAIIKLGGGNLKRGHAVLDKFVLHTRKKTRQTLGKLKGPVK